MTNGTKKGWGVSVTPRPLFTPRKDPVPIIQEARWVPEPVWTGVENLASNGIRSPDHPARSVAAMPTTLPGPLEPPDLLKFFEEKKNYNFFWMNSFPISARSLLFRSLTLRPFVLLVRTACVWRWSWSIDGMILTYQIWSTGKRPISVPLCPPQIPHEWPRNQIWASAVRGRRLTAWLMA